MFWRQNPEYWGRAGAGLIPVAEDTGRFLVALRSWQVNEPGTWGTIGGKVDDVYTDEGWVSEDPEEAALREFREETRSRLRPHLVPMLVFRDGDFSYYNFLGVVPREFDAEANWETDEWAWVTFDELVDLEDKHFGVESILGDPESVKTMLYHSRVQNPPARYTTGVKGAAKKRRLKEFEKRAEMDWEDPAAYKPFPSDKGKKTRPSKYTRAYHEEFGEENAGSVDKVARATGIPRRILQEVYDRGMAAWRTGHRPGASQQAWGMARVYSFVMGGKTFHTTDADLARQL